MYLYIYVYIYMMAIFLQNASKCLNKSGFLHLHKFTNVLIIALSIISTHGSIH